MAAFRDLRDFIGRLALELGEDQVRVVDGANWNLEISCLTELMAEKEGPALLFDNIVGYPKGFRVLTNFMGTAARCALALGISPKLSKVEMVRAWKEKSKLLKFIPPKEVTTGSVMENVVEGDAVDLAMFPAPKWHERDGGRYIGTADMVITRDPDTGWVNFGAHRGCIQGKDRLSLWFTTKSRHAHQIASKYWAKGQACPIAVVLGCDPVIWTASPAALPIGTSEYDLAGAFRGEPVEVIRAPGTGLPIPAHAEIVVEGEMPPVEEESAQEGPFGEWPGYYTHIGPETVVRVKRIMYRNDPILLGAPPLLPTTPCGHQALPRAAVSTWDHLESAGVPNVRGVWVYARGLMVVVSIEQRYDSHAVQALIAAAGRRRNFAMDTFVVVVDEDIDPSDLNQVLWALCTRVDPAKSVQILRALTTDLDPRLSPKKRADQDYSMGLMLIDACKPYAWKDQFPLTNRFDEPYREEVRKRWRSKLPL